MSAIVHKNKDDSQHIAAIIYKAKNEKDIEKMRYSKTTKERFCLKCDKKFKSFHFANRLCADCDNQNKYLSRSSFDN